MNKNNNQKGQVLFEILLAVAIIAGVVAVSAQLSQMSLQSADVAGDRTVAANLAREGFEAARAIAGENWVTFHSVIKGNQYHPEVQSGKWVLVSGSESVTINGETYTRYLIVENVSRNLSSGDIETTYNSANDDPSTQKVTVTIQKSGLVDIAYSEYITRWRNASPVQKKWQGGGGQTDNPMSGDSANFDDSSYFSKSYIDITDSEILKLEVQLPTGIATFVAAGALAKGMGAITPALPTGIATNDILLLFIKTSNQAITIPTPNGGMWTEVTGSPQGTGTGANTTSARLTAFWSRYNGTQGAPTTSDSGDDQIGQIIAVSGVTTSGNPWDVTAGGVDATANTTASIPGTNTTVAGAFIVGAIATALPDANTTTNFSAWTNTNLASVTERADNTMNFGVGGGLGIVTGTEATIGAYGNTTVTLANASVKAMMSIALKPQVVGDYYRASGTLISSTFYTGSANGAAFNSVLWKGSLNNGRVKLQIAASNNNSPFSANFYGEDVNGNCSVSNWYESSLPNRAVKIGSCYSKFNNKRYFRYKIMLCSSNDCVTSGNNTPQVDDIVINFSP